eukprot:jgi/Tetstr1/465147/TSEL_009870.t1
MAPGGTSLVSRAFLAPKPGGKWPFIIDLRHHLSSYGVRKRIRMETLMGFWHLTKKGDYMFSFGLKDGFYALGIAETDRDYFPLDIRGTPYRLEGLPMGCSLSPYYLTTFTRWEARGFRCLEDERQHITRKALRSLESFLAHLAGRDVLMHEVNQAMCHVLTILTSRSAAMMAELHTAAALDPVLFAKLDARFGPHTIDRFASALNAMLLRYDMAWLDPTCEAVDDALHMADAIWLR